MRKHFAAFAVALSLMIGAVALPSAVHASDIKFVVNGTAVTSYDVQRRAAFLKLQRRTGDLAKMAGDEMVDQALRMQEVARLNIKITDQAVDDAYQRFAKSNKLPGEQLGKILEQSGVTKAHFKDFIRAQMAWNQAVSARYSSRSNRLSQGDAVQKMFKEKGSKPTAREYMLQQVIFVIPAAERKASLGKRRQEAESMRQRFQSCETTREFAKGLIDVTVRDMGRKLEPALPQDWADAIKGMDAGSATPVRETQRGIEFIGVCSTREVSDDRVSQMLAQSEGAQGKNGEESSKQYMEDLRKRAKIVRR